MCYKYNNCHKKELVNYREEFQIIFFSTIVAFSPAVELTGITLLTQLCLYVCINFISTRKSHHYINNAFPESRAKES